MYGAIIDSPTTGRSVLTDIIKGVNHISTLMEIKCSYKKAVAFAEKKGSFILKQLWSSCKTIEILRKN